MIFIAPHSFFLNAIFSIFVTTISHAETRRAMLSRLQVFAQQLFNNKIATLLLFILIELESSSKFPNYSENELVSYKNLLEDKVHKCYCEPYDEERLKNKTSYIKFWVRHLHESRILKKYN